jgi:hypothetical protein
LAPKELRFDDGNATPKHAPGPVLQFGRAAAGAGPSRGMFSLGPKPGGVPPSGQQSFGGPLMNARPPKAQQAPAAGGAGLFSNGGVGPFARPRQGASTSRYGMGARARANAGGTPMGPSGTRPRLTGAMQGQQVRNSSGTPGWQQQLGAGSTPARLGDKRPAGISHMEIDGGSGFGECLGGLSFGLSFGCGSRQLAWDNMDAQTAGTCFVGVLCACPQCRGLVLTNREPAALTHNHYAADVLTPPLLLPRVYFDAGGPSSKRLRSATPDPSLRLLGLVSSPASGSASPSQGPPGGSSASPSSAGLGAAAAAAGTPMMHATPAAATIMKTLEALDKVRGVQRVGGSGGWGGKHTALQAYWLQRVCTCAGTCVGGGGW